MTDFAFHEMTAVRTTGLLGNLRFIVREISRRVRKARTDSQARTQRRVSRAAQLDTRTLSDIGFDRTVFAHRTTQARVSS